MDGAAGELGGGGIELDVAGEAEAAVAGGVEADEAGGVDAAVVEDEGVAAAGVEGAGADDISGEDGVVDCEGALEDLAGVDGDSATAGEFGAFDGDVFAEVCEGDGLGEGVEIGAVGDADGGELFAVGEISTVGVVGDGDAFAGGGAASCGGGDAIFRAGTGVFSGDLGWDDWDCLPRTEAE